MKNIVMYTGPSCNFCDAAKRLLVRNNATFSEIDIASKAGLMEEMIQKANGKRTIPQIFIDDKHIGGYQELRALEKEASNLRLDLRTYEINHQNASEVLKKAEINISELNPSDYQGMDLSELESSLDEIQKNIASLGSINLASPDEYLERQNDLSKSIEESSSKKLELQNH